MTSSYSTGAGSTSSPAFGQAMYTMYRHVNIPSNASPTKETKRRGVVGWQEWDYLDYADFEKAISEGRPLSYALCQWFIRQPYGNPNDPFTESEWQEWYEYAVEHCSRFAREQPKRRR